IKDVLTSTAMPVDGYTVYLQGSGRVDAARATTQQVYATGQADFRLMDEEDQVTGRTVTYTNLGDEDVTLSLDLEVTRAGTAAPEGMFTLSADSVTVPAGGTADVSLTLDPALGDVGRYSGFLVGTGAPDVVVTTAVGLEKEPPSANLILNVFDRNGLPPAAATLFVQDTSDPGRYFQRHGAGNTNRAVIRLPIGQYTIYGDIASRDPHGGGLHYASDVFALVEVDVTEEGAEVTLDARTAQDIRMEVAGDDRPLHPMRINQGMYLESANGVPTSFQLGSDPSSIATRHGAIPSGKPTVGKLYHSVYLTQREPLLRARIVEPAPADLVTLPARSGARFDGTRTAPLVFAGAGEPADYEGLDADGAVVLVTASSGLTQLAETAAAHGAAALRAAQDEPGVLFPTVAAGTELPVLGTTYEEGQRLRDLLPAGPVSVELTGTRESRYGYPLRLNSFDGIPDDLSVTLDPADLTRVVNHFHSDTTDRVGREFFHSFAPWEFVTGGQVLDLHQPVRRVDHVVPGADMRYQHMVWAGPGTAEVNQLEPIHATYAAGERVDVHWNRQPYRPSEDGREECNFCRTATQLRFAPSPNGGTHPTQFGGNRASVARTAFRDGVPVANLADLLVPEEATYRIVDRMQRVGSPDITMARQVETEWTFRSQAPDEREIPGCEEVLTGATECAALPVLMPRYQVPLILLNQAPDDRTYEITVHVDRPIGYRGNDGAVHLGAWVSYDGGETWQSAAVARQDGGGFTVTAGHPPLAATNGFVSLRVEAADGTGNRTRQAITNAYQLSEDACVRTHRADEPIVFGDQDSGVPDRDRADGCTFQDLIATAGPFGTHGEFVRAVVELSGQWLRDGLLDQRERVAILVAAARSDVGR